MFEDIGSTRIDLACPSCQQLFKVRLRKLQFGADLICRLCRHEFSAQDVSDRVEVQEALARMHQIGQQRVQYMAPCNADGTVDPVGEILGHHSTRTRKHAKHLNELPNDGEAAGDSCRTTSYPQTLKAS